MSTPQLDAHSKIFTGAGAVLEDGQEMTGDDVLIVVDMQNDFVPPGSFGVEGCGAFGVSDGDAATTQVVNLIQKAAKVGAKIVATRDYHPDDHCSFASNGGIFPPHCVQGGKGAEFVPPVTEALTEAEKDGAEVIVVFKGFNKVIDSFGAFPYSDDQVSGGRVSVGPCGACATAWTGSFAFKRSSAKASINSPPDVMAVLDREKTGLDRILTDTTQRLIVCGLAFDFCVLDTALNAAENGYSKIEIVYDACRSAHIPDVGNFDGFLSDPSEIIAKTTKAGVRLVKSTSTVV